MTSAIASSTASAHTAPVAVSPRQVKTGATDSDGDPGGAKVAAASAPKASSATVGTILNTTA